MGYGMAELGHPEQVAIFKGKAEVTSHRTSVIHDSVFRQDVYGKDIRYKDQKIKKAIEKRQRRKNDFRLAVPEFLLLYNPIRQCF